VHQADDALDALLPNSIRPFNDQLRRVRRQISSASSLQSVVPQWSVNTSQRLGNDPYQQLVFVSGLDSLSETNKLARDLLSLSLNFGFHVAQAEFSLALPPPECMRGILVTVLWMLAAALL